MCRGCVPNDFGLCRGVVPISWLGFLRGARRSKKYVFYNESELLGLRFPKRILGLGVLVAFFGNLWPRWRPRVMNVARYCSKKQWFGHFRCSGVLADCLGYRIVLCGGWNFTRLYCKIHAIVRVTPPKFERNTWFRDEAQ